MEILHEYFKFIQTSLRQVTVSCLQLQEGLNVVANGLQALKYTVNYFLTPVTSTLVILSNFKIGRKMYPNEIIMQVFLSYTLFWLLVLPKYVSTEP